MPGWNGHLLGLGILAPAYRQQSMVQMSMNEAAGHACPFGQNLIPSLPTGMAAGLSHGRAARQSGRGGFPFYLVAGVRFELASPGYEPSELPDCSTPRKLPDPGGF